MEAGTNVQVNDADGVAADAARRRVRHGLVALTVAAAVAAPIVAGGCGVVGRIALNHNETAGRDRMPS